MYDGFVVRDGVRLHFLRWPSQGAPHLLLLSGTGGGGGSARYWLPFVEAIGNRLDVVAVEQRGNAHSDWCARYQSADLVADVSTVVEELELGPTILAGHSTGGALGWLYASEHPEKVSSFIDIESGTPYARADSSAQMAVFPSRDAFLELARSRWVVDPSMDDVVRAWIADGTMQLDDGRWTWRQDPRFFAARTRGDLFPAEEEFFEHVRRTSCPVLIVRGAKSTWPRDAAEHLCACAAHARVVDVPDAGHVVPLANPLGLYRVVADFLGLSERAQL